MLLHLTKKIILLFKKTNLQLLLLRPLQVNYQL
jgi:hypothetical protein